MTTWSPRTPQFSSRTRLLHPRSHPLAPDTLRSNSGSPLPRDSHYHRARPSPRSPSLLPSHTHKRWVKRGAEHTLVFTSPSHKRPTCLPHCTSASQFSRDQSAYPHRPGQLELAQYPRAAGIFSPHFRVMSPPHLHHMTKTRRPLTQNWNQR